VRGWVRGARLCGRRASNGIHLIGRPDGSTTDQTSPLDMRSQGDGDRQQEMEINPIDSPKSNKHEVLGPGLHGGPN
jgi:hypothetical protein